MEAVPHQLLPGGLARHRQRAGRGGGDLHHQLLCRDTGQPPTGMSHHVADVAHYLEKAPSPSRYYTPSSCTSE